MPDNHQKLNAYTRKRDFAKTPEPIGEEARGTEGELRFVVQHHSASRDHYDFRLEWDHVLKSWAIPKGPSFDPHDKRLAVQVEDHPLDYRNFEGTIPKGEYGGGTVMIWDEGYWEPLVDPVQGFQDGNLKFILHGKRLKGRWAMIRMKQRKGDKNSNWLLIKEKDEYVQSESISLLSASVRTGRTMAEIEKAGKPKPQKEYCEQLKVCDVAVSHPNKIIYPESGISKGAIAEYYSEVSPKMMPFVEKRLISSVRCPEGIGGSCFFKKHPVGTLQGIDAYTVYDEEGKPEEYFYIKEAQGMLSEVHMNTVEFHVWGSKIDTLEQPDTMVFDLDPDEGMGLDQIRRGVKDLKSILDDLSLTCFLKTSGGKGYHIVVPFKPKAPWDVFRSFAQNIARAMEARWPDRYTSNSRKAARQGRIYIDWQRNIRGATSVAPYSLRKREGAPVSMPISWEELDAVTPQGITLQGSLERLTLSDPWAHFFDVEQELKQI